MIVTARYHVNADNDTCTISDLNAEMAIGGTIFQVPPCVAVLYLARWKRDNSIIEQNQYNLPYPTNQGTHGSSTSMGPNQEEISS